jgi:hypothetical protein
MAAPAQAQINQLNELASLLPAGVELSDFSAEELEEVLADPEACGECEGEPEWDGMDLLRGMSEGMEEEDCMGFFPTGRAELESRDAHKNAPEATTKRGSNWQPWEDRALVKETLAVDPYTCERGTSGAQWEKISESKPSNHARECKYYSNCCTGMKRVKSIRSATSWVSSFVVCGGWVCLTSSRG